MSISKYKLRLAAIPKEWAEWQKKTASNFAPNEGQKPTERPKTPNNLYNANIIHNEKKYYNFFQRHLVAVGRELRCSFYRPVGHAAGFRLKMVMRPFLGQKW